MFKFVALCAVIAAAAAEPGLLATPLTYTSITPLAYKAIAPASYISPVGSYIQPTIYSTPYGYSHLIKKRSAVAYSSYIPSTYVATPLATPLATTYTAPVVSSPIYSVSSPLYTHFIKKRSAPLAISTYIAPRTYAAPVLSTYSARLYPAPYLHTPLGYAHYIKK